MPPGQELSGLTKDPQKRERFYGEAVGYYAGASLTEPEKKDPEQVEMKVTVHNEEVLYVEVEIPSGVNGLKLWVEGAASGAKGWIDLNSFTQDERVLMKGAGSVCDVILDDISIQGARCADLRGDMRSDHGGNDIALIPGRGYPYLRGSSDRKRQYGSRSGVSDKQPVSESR